MLGDILEIIADGKTGRKGLGSIPNPTRKITVNFSIDAVKTAIKSFPDQSKKLVSKTYRLQEAEDIINYYMLEATEFLSFGVFVDINLTDINETRTEIAVEVRRKVGSFDETQEIQLAGTHINRVLTGIGKLLEGGGKKETPKPTPAPAPKAEKKPEVKKPAPKAEKKPKVKKLVVEKPKAEKKPKVKKEKKVRKPVAKKPTPQPKPKKPIKTTAKLVNGEYHVNSFAQLYELANNIAKRKTA